MLIGLKDWQTAVSALLGFSAVVITLAVNGWLARRAYRRDRSHERRVLAASLLSEIATLASLMDELRLREMLENLKVSMQQHVQIGEPWPNSSEEISFPVTIYEKCADRLGVLDIETASGVVRYYNSLNGFRSGLRSAIGAGGQRIESRIATVEFLIRLLDTGAPKIPILKARLAAIAAPGKEPHSPGI